MNSNHNMLSNETNDVKNKGFAILHSIFKKYGWHIIKNEMNWLYYSKFGDETSYFDIRILPDKIITCVPIKNSSYQYTTTFKNYYDASEYLEQRLYDYML